MAFLPNIPQPTDQLSISQANILNNFQILGAIAGNANAGSATINNIAGFNQINLALQGGTVPNFNGNNGFWAGNFTHDATTTVETWAQYNQGTGLSAGQYQYPISASILSLFPTLASAPPGNGWSYLSSGILVKWGNSSGGTTVNIDTQSGGPAYTKTFAAFITPFGSVADYYTSTFTAAPGPTLTANFAIVPTHQYYYYIIGF